MDYLAGLTVARTVLWCYLLWYLVILARYFEANGRLWATSLGLSLIIGVALVLNSGVSPGQLLRLRVTAPAAAINGWQMFRFFLMPFGVSSFAALVKGKGFVLVFSPHLSEVALGVGVCLSFLAFVWFARAMKVRMTPGRVASLPSGQS